MEKFPSFKDSQFKGFSPFERFLVLKIPHLKDSRFYIFPIPWSSFPTEYACQIWGTEKYTG